MQDTTNPAIVAEISRRATGNLTRLTNVGRALTAGKANRADYADALDGAVSILEDAGHAAEMTAREIIRELGADTITPLDAVMSASPVRVALGRLARLADELDEDEGEAPDLYLCGVSGKWLPIGNPR